MPHRLIADAMLGRVARWLRALGHDVLFDPALDDPRLAELATAQNRTLLTRDRGLCRERGCPDWCVLLAAEKPRAQLVELHRHLPVFTDGWDERLFTRCMVCNTPLTLLDPATARGRVPEAIRSDPEILAAGVRACPRCDRVYWEGSHARRMRAWLGRTAGAAD